MNSQEWYDQVVADVPPAETLRDLMPTTLRGDLEFSPEMKHGRIVFFPGRRHGMSAMLKALAEAVADDPTNRVTNLSKQATAHSDRVPADQPCDCETTRREHAYWCVFHNRPGAVHPSGIVGSESPNLEP